MTLPNYLIIGAQKAGSSWLAKRLSQHPDVYVYPGEIHYFDKRYNFDKGIAWYEKHFEEVQSEKIVGEKTPDYFWANGIGTEDHLPQVHQNIAKCLPDVKLIVVLRNPVSRAASAAKHIIRSGRISPFHTLDELLCGDKQELLREHGVLEYGHYYDQLYAYFEIFPHDKVLILIFEEDIVVDPRAGLYKACEFLGVDTSYRFSDLNNKVNEVRETTFGLVVRNLIPLGDRYMRDIDQRYLRRILPVYTPKISRKCRKSLESYYASHNEKLFELLGRRISSWA